MNPSEHITAYIDQLQDWRGEMLTHYRALIHQVVPGITEDWKWGVPVFLHGKMVFAMSAFKDHVKINFFRCAELVDTHKLFNSGLDSKGHRSINIAQGEKVNEKALSDLLLAAVELAQR